LEGDLIYTGKVINKMCSTDSMAVSPLKPYMDGTVVTKDDDNYVKMMYLKSSRKRPEKSELLYKTVNIYSFSQSSHEKFIKPGVQRLVEEGLNQSYYEQAFTTVIEDKSFPIRAITFDDKSWYEIDTEKDLREAKKIFNKNN
jgi:NDP-sugar pyrophosphorylase family protein